MRIKAVTLCHLYFLLGILFLGLADCMDMRGMEHGVDAPAYIAIFKLLVMLFWFGAVVKLAMPQYKLYMFPLPLVLYTAFYMWSYLPTLLMQNATISEIANNLTTIMTPLIVMLSAFNTAVQTDNEKWDKTLYLLLFTLLLFQYFNIFREINFLEMAHLTCSYYILLALPLLLLFNSKVIKVGAVIIVILALFSSLKRSGILALALALFFYIFISQYVRSKFNIKSFIGSLLLIAIIGTVFIVLGTNESEDENIYQRFENIDRDNGSGRIEVWEQTATMISKQSTGMFLLGNGYGTVLRNSQLQLSAHNDFLEVTYDYGFVGLLLYLAAFISLSIYIIKMILEHSRFAPPFVLLLVIYLILSMISHIIIYYWSNLVMLAIGYIIGKYKKDAVVTQNYIQ